MTKSQWINRIAIGGTILLASIGGLWLWDAKDYPIPGIDSSKVDSTEIKPNWRWWRGLTFAENIKANQLWLRRERSQRLQKKRVLNLSLKESYWELEQFYGTSQSPGTTIVYFDNNGGIEARNKLGLPDAFKGVSGYQRPKKTSSFLSAKAKIKLRDSQSDVLMKNSCFFGTNSTIRSFILDDYLTPQPSIAYQKATE